MAKLLILTPQLPYPPHQGTSLRNYHIIRGLAEEHQIVLMSYVETGQSADHQAIKPLLEVCAAVETVPAPRRSRALRLQQLLLSRKPDMAMRLASQNFNQALLRLLEKHQFDIVQIEGLELASAIATVRRASLDSMILFDDHNAETELQRRALHTDLRQPGRWHAAAYSWVQVGRLRRFESWACRHSDWVTVVSEGDQQHLQTMLGGRKPTISVIPNCLDVAWYREGAKQVNAAADGEAGDPADLLFSGKMDYRPNVDAVLWFAAEIWPIIRSQRPDTTWAIVGQQPHRRIKQLQELEGVTVTGWVPDVRPYLSRAAVYVMPFRLGSGTRLKLIEAMALGRAIVSTPFGAEGFPVTHGGELLLAADAEEFASAVLHLLEDREERQRLGQAAEAFAWYYDWRTVVPRFSVIHRQMLAL